MRLIKAFLLRRRLRATLAQINRLDGEIGAKEQAVIEYHTEVRPDLQRRAERLRHQLSGQLTPSLPVLGQVQRGRPALHVVSGGRAA